MLLVFNSADDVDAPTNPLIELEILEERETMAILDCIPAGDLVLITTKSRAASGRFSHSHGGGVLEVGKFVLEEATLMQEMALDDNLLMGTLVATQQRSMILELKQCTREQNPQRPASAQDRRNL